MDEKIVCQGYCAFRPNDASWGPSWIAGGQPEKRGWTLVRDARFDPIDSECASVWLCSNCSTRYKAEITEEDALLNALQDVHAGFHKAMQRIALEWEVSGG